MSPVSLLCIAVALSIDNFAIAVAAGASNEGRRDFLAALRLPLVFLLCSSLAPALGWWIGSRTAGFVHGYAGVAVFIVLVAVGWRTFRSAWRSDGADVFDISSLRATLLLGIVTSGDALTVGFGLGIAAANVVQLSIAVGAIAGAMSIAGLLLGSRLSRQIGARGKALAGIVLMLVGVRALVR